MTRVAVPSTHTSAFVTVGGRYGGKRAVLDVAPTGPTAGPTAGSTAEPVLPVLLVPGFTGSKEDFTPVLDGIAAAGHRVVALDLAGQWESEGADDPAAYLPDALANDLPQVLTELGISRAHLVGHSYGGLVCRAAVLADATPWASLTLLCSGPAALVGGPRGGTELMQAAAAGMALDPLYDALLDYWASRGEEVPTGELLKFQRRRFTGGVAAALVGMATGLLDEPDRVAALRDAAAAAGLPVSVVFGESDDAWPPAVQLSMAERLGVAPTVIAGAGHSPAYDDPARTVEVLTGLWG